MMNLKSTILRAMTYLACLAIVILPTALFFLLRRRFCYLDVLAFGAFVTSFVKQEYWWVAIFSATFVVKSLIAEGVRKSKIFKLYEESLGDG